LNAQAERHRCPTALEARGKQVERSLALVVQGRLARHEGVAARMSPERQRSPPLVGGSYQVFGAYETVSLLLDKIPAACRRELSGFRA